MGRGSKAALTMTRDSGSELNLKLLPLRASAYLSPVPAMLPLLLPPAAYSQVQLWLGPAPAWDMVAPAPHPCQVAAGAAAPALAQAPALIQSWDWGQSCHHCNKCCWASQGLKLILYSVPLAGVGLEPKMQLKVSCGGGTDSKELSKGASSAESRPRGKAAEEGQAVGGKL